MGFRNLSLQDSLKAFGGDVTYSKAELEAAVAAEREACATVCDAIEDVYCHREYHRYPEMKTDAQTGAGECAAAIRARGKK